MRPRRVLALAAVAAAGVAALAGEGRGGLFGRTLTDAQQVIADTRINHGDLTIEATTDREDTTYEPGRPITLTVKVNKPANVAILRVLANGDTALVFPNRAHPKADAAPDAPLTVPAPGEKVKIAIDKPQIVLFEFVASTAGDSWLFTRAPDSGSDFANLGVTTHALARYLVSTLRVGKGPETAATYVTVRVGGGLF
jgi:uncharacterized protein DUF4384